MSLERTVARVSEVLRSCESWLVQVPVCCGTLRLCVEVDSFEVFGTVCVVFWLVLMALVHSS